MKLSFKQKFNTRQEISVLLGGDTQKGIAVSAQTDTILLFMNDGEIYTDYFLPFKLIVATAWVANFNVDYSSEDIIRGRNHNGSCTHYLPSFEQTNLLWFLPLNT